MEKRDRLSRAVKTIAWGYILLHLHFNLGTLDILPDWLGLVLILKALPALTEQCPSSAVLRPFAVGLAIWEGVEWLFCLFGASLELGVLGIIGSIAALYFRFQLITEISRGAEAHNCPQAGRLRILRNVDAVMITLFALPIPWDRFEALSILLIIVEICAALLICGSLFSLSRYLVDPLPYLEQEMN